LLTVSSFEEDWSDGGGGGPSAEEDLKLPAIYMGGVGNTLTTTVRQIGTLACEIAQNKGDMFWLGDYCNASDNASADAWWQEKGGSPTINNCFSRQDIPELPIIGEQEGTNYSKWNQLFGFFGAVLTQQGAADTGGIPSNAWNWTTDAEPTNPAIAAYTVFQLGVNSQNFGINNVNH
jgi:hypothetical protein